MNNSLLHTARINKKDEFYTPLSIIEDTFKENFDIFCDKTVYCNCDDYNNSNFVKYFIENFEALKLKGLYASGFSIEKKQYNNILHYSNGRKEFIEYPIFDKYPAGEFRHRMSLSILNKSDIVISNPPFSLFSEYVKTIKKKKFLIIGGNTSVTLKTVATEIITNKLWLMNKGQLYGEFIPSSDYENYSKSSVIKIPYRWFTNIEKFQNRKELNLTKSYDEHLYPRLDNYNAINVSTISDIPSDYLGAMAVPITFLDHWCQTQFSIINGLNTRPIIENDPLYNGNPHSSMLNGNIQFFKYVIKRKNG